ncbi:ABC transporter substrate-binding protein [Salinactinospora qingdaonensis]|uniref:ABC transporter substrate-binding protein n=1 Tax=Salinactinospora qingdaonensis TaxID=702744 RepID=A0ABP7GGE6_9ACTN
MPPTPRPVGLSRRGFLGATAVTLAATACAPSTGGGSAPSTGGRLRAAFAGGGAQEVLDPHQVSLFVDAARAKALYDKLADQGSDMAVVPRLAESWEPGPDLTTWRVRLREATFHDGSPVRAADVLYSYARILDPEQGHRAKSDLAPIDIEASHAVDERTIEFVLHHPFAEFSNILAAFGAYIVPEGATQFDTPVGSGPFSFVSFEPGRNFVVRRFDDYWEGAPRLDELEIVVSNEESARINALLGGQVDYAHDISATTARAQQGEDSVNLVSSPNSNMMGFAMKLDRPPFDDLRVRQAMFALCDRRELVDTVLSGEGSVGNDLFGKGFKYYAADIAQRERDLDTARRLLREAGAENLPVTLETADVAAGFPEAASVFADQMRAAGIDATVNQRNPDTYWADTLDGGHLSVNRSGAMPIGSHISQRLLSDSPTNVTKWQREEFDALYTKLQSTADETERAGYYERMQRQLHEEGGYLIWGFANWIVATGAQVRGVEQAPANTLDWARFDKVWLE